MFGIKGSSIEMETKGEGPDYAVPGRVTPGPKIERQKKKENG
jgi:hypothetical protein